MRPAETLLRRLLVWQDWFFFIFIFGFLVAIYAYSERRRGVAAYFLLFSWLNIFFPSPIVAYQPQRYLYLLIGLPFFWWSLRVRRPYRMLLSLWGPGAWLGAVAAGVVAFYTLLQSSPDFARSKPAASAAGPLIMHLSDTHFLEKGVLQTRQNVALDSKAYKRLLESVSGFKPRYLILTGDVTDAGTAGEWEQAGEFLEGAAKLGIRILIAPGNHDLQPGMKLLATVPPSTAMSDLAVRFFKAQTRYGVPLKTWDGFDLKEMLTDYTRTVPVLDDPQKKYQSCFDGALAAREMSSARSGMGVVMAARSCEKAAKIPSYSEARILQLSAYKEWFPLVYDDPKSSSVFVILNSNMKETIDITNVGIGSLGAAQISHLRQYLKQMPRRERLFILLHHPVTRPQGENLCRGCLTSMKAFSDSPLYNYALLRNDAKDSTELANLLQETAGDRKELKINILYGHRHARYFGELYLGITLVQASALYEAPGVWLADRKLEWSYVDLSSDLKTKELKSPK